MLMNGDVNYEIEIRLLHRQVQTCIEDEINEVCDDCSAKLAFIEEYKKGLNSGE